MKHGGFQRFGLLFFLQIAFLGGGCGSQDTNCLSEKCGPIGATCEGDGECEGGLQCVESVCTNPDDPPPVFCDSEADCDAGQVCSAGQCDEPSAAGDSCDLTLECKNGLSCIGGECLAPDATGCESDSDCGGDTYCCIGDCLDGGDSVGLCIPYGKGDRDDTNPQCVGTVTIGLFLSTPQCEWSGPPEGDEFPDHVNILGTPLVADLPYDSGNAAEIIIVSYNGEDGGTKAARGVDENFFGVIRVLNGQDCSQLATIHDPANPVVGSSVPSIANIDSTAWPEIVTYRGVSGGGGLIAFTWDEVAQTYETLWTTSGTDTLNSSRYDGPSIHDLDDDGVPEIIAASEVYDGPTGTRLNPGQVVANYLQGYISVVGDVDDDGEVELVARQIWRWNSTTTMWDVAYPTVQAGSHFAYADFGTPGATASDFQIGVFDGRAEIVSSGGNRSALYTLEGQVLFESTSILGGGPPTIGDFDADGIPEFAVAGGTEFVLYDLDCEGATKPGCEGNFVRWRQPSQDKSSRTTGSAVFDFEGDGRAEAVYADECYTRIYKGDTGDVLYSAYRTSCTWYENPVIADPDRDQNTEILVGSNSNCNISCDSIDPIHRGDACEVAGDCVSGSCIEGYCRCADDSQCPADTLCRDAPVGTPGAGKTCRAHHPGTGRSGIRVLRDRLDRWSSSRTMWNQHAYSVTNINDDLTVPSTSERLRNYKQDDLNNFRQNVQGETSSTDFPDITGKLNDANVCVSEDSAITLTATVCNRGKRTVGAALPGAFYAGTVADEALLCVSYTDGPVPVGGCLEVSCGLEGEVEGDIIFVVNDDGAGGQTTVECNPDNNVDETSLDDGCISIE